MVRVKLFATLAQIAGRREVEVEAASASQLLQRLYELFGEAFRRELEQDMIMLVNGHNVEHLKGMDTPLKDGDVVSLFPPAGGG